MLARERVGSAVKQWFKVSRRQIFLLLLILVTIDCCAVTSVLESVALSHCSPEHFCMCERKPCLFLSTLAKPSQPPRIVSPLVNIAFISWDTEMSFKNWIYQSSAKHPWNISTQLDLKQRHTLKNTLQNTDVIFLKSRNHKIFRFSCVS